MLPILNFDKIKGLIYTERSNALIDIGKYTFEVSHKCNKREIKSLIKKLYGIEVSKVNIINSKPKIKRFKGVLGKKAFFKKAIITTKNNQTINFGS